MPSSSQAGTVPSILSVLSNCYKRSKHLAMFVMFSYLLAMKCFLAVTEWAVDVPSTRCRDFNYPGAVQDLETLSSGGEIRNISGSSHCRLKPLGTQLSYRNYLLSICLWCGRYRNRNRRSGHILRRAHKYYLTSHSPRHKCWKRGDMLVILIITTLVHRDIWQGRLLGEARTMLWRVKLDLLFLYVEIIAGVLLTIYPALHTTGHSDSQYCL